MFKTIFSYAFRPLYTIAALYVVSIILLWYPLGFQGNAQYPSFFWHGHEMIWGFTGAIMNCTPKVGHNFGVFLYGEVFF